MSAGRKMAGATEALYKLHAKLPYRLEMDGLWHVARCELLRITSQGKSKRTAVRNLKDAIALKVQVNLERGTLAKTLKACGFYQIRIGDNAYWAAPPSNDEENQLVMRPQLRVKGGSKKDPPLEKQQIPNNLEWYIEGKFRQPQPRRPRAA